MTSMRGLVAGGSTSLLLAASVWADTDPATSCSPEAQRQFERALAMPHRSSSPRRSRRSRRFPRPTRPAPSPTGASPSVSVRTRSWGRSTPLRSNVGSTPSRRARRSAPRRRASTTGSPPSRNSTLVSSFLSRFRSFLPSDYSHPAPEQNLLRATPCPHGSFRPSSIPRLTGRCGGGQSRASPANAAECPWSRAARGPPSSWRLPRRPERTPRGVFAPALLRRIYAASSVSARPSGIADERLQCVDASLRREGRPVDERRSVGAVPAIH